MLQVGGVIFLIGQTEVIKELFRTRMVHMAKLGFLRGYGRSRQRQHLSHGTL